MSARLHMSIAGCLVLCLAMGTAAYLYLINFEEPYLSYKNLPFPPLPPARAHPGDVIPLRVIRCSTSTTQRAYAISRTLESLDTGALYELPGSTVRIKPGCHDETSLANVLPREIRPGVFLPSGRYRMIGLSEVRGSFRTVNVSWNSAPFAVVPFEVKP